MFGLGTTELLIIGAIFILLFGSTRLPGLMNSIGRSVVEFKKGVSGVEDEIEESSKSISQDKDESKSA